MKQKILWSPVNAIFSNYPPATCVCGVPGSGKTYFLVNTVLSTMDMGCNVFCVDAKNDLLPIQNVYPDTSVIDVNKISDGALDPFLVFDDCDESVLITIVNEMCGGLEKHEESAISPIISDFIKSYQLNKKVTFREFCEYLYANKNETAQIVGNRLLSGRRTPYGRLLFDDPAKKIKKFSLNQKRTVISILGMNLPSELEVKADERVNSTIIYIIIRLIRRMLTYQQKALDKGDAKTATTPSLLVLDECHLLMKSKAICSAINEFLVIGRSLGVSVLMASQNVSHFDSDIATFVSTKVCFRSSRREAEEFLKLFDLSDGSQKISREDIIQTITKLKTGNCLMIDKHNNTGFMRVLSNYDHETISSNPQEKARKALKEGAPPKLRIKVG